MRLKVRFELVQKGEVVTDMVREFPDTTEGSGLKWIWMNWCLARHFTEVMIYGDAIRFVVVNPEGED